jgi:hypothetical protein
LARVWVRRDRGTSGFRHTHRSSTWMYAKGMKDEGLRFAVIVFHKVTPSSLPSCPSSHLPITGKTNLKRSTYGFYIMPLPPCMRTELPFKPWGRYRSCIFMCNNNIRSVRTIVLGLPRVLSCVIANIVGVRHGRPGDE